MSDVDSYIYPINGKITRTVASNNLTVAVKNYDGNDFSVGSPLVHKIRDTPRSLSGALSVTVNAGANTFNLGAAEFKTLRQDLFVYLGWRASNSSMFILLSRIPYAVTYADFSSTATNEKYGAYSGGAPASTDPVENIGRVSVQNSGTASYNWSVPTANVIVNRPIYETGWLLFTSVLTGFSGTPTQTGKYMISGEKISMLLNISGTSNTTGFTATTPLANGYSDNLYIGGFRAEDNGTPITATVTAGVLAGSSTTITFYKDWAASGWTATGTKTAQISLTYGW